MGKRERRNPTIQGSGRTIVVRQCSAASTARPYNPDPSIWLGNRPHQAPSSNAAPMTLATFSPGAMMNSETCRDGRRRSVPAAVALKCTAGRRSAVSTVRLHMCGCAHLLPTATYIRQSDCKGEPSLVLGWKNVSRAPSSIRGGTAATPCEVVGVRVMADEFEPPCRGDISLGHREGDLCGSSEGSERKGAAAA
jgi:hypothetical protein